MKKIVEKSLEAALIKASNELHCSVADLEYEVVQNPSNGFLGLGKKEAIIIVDNKVRESSIDSRQDSKEALREVKSADSSPKAPLADTSYEVVETSSLYYENNGTQEIWGIENTQIEQHLSQNLTQEVSLSYTDKEHEANVAAIKSELEELFSFLPFEIDCFEVRLEEDKSTIFIYIDGRDCALLIGERGYRYKALSYLLFNWINPKYGYSLRLEIAEFLKNQEEMIDVYLRDIIRAVNQNGKASTKPLDGILVYIALSKLREIFPDKYVSVRLTEDSEKYIIVNDFRR